MLRPDEGNLDHVVPLARWRGHVGKPRVVEQGGQHPQGQPPVRFSFNRGACYQENAAAGLSIRDKFFDGHPIFITLPAFPIPLPSS
jgi:hypothetical protein